MVKSRSLSWRLGILTLVVVLPLAVFALMMIGWIAYSDREATRKALSEDASALADNVARGINIVSRLPREPGIPGTFASKEFRDATRRPPKSIVTHTSISGQKVVSAYAPVSGGWTVGVTAGASELGLGPGAFLLTSILAALAITGSLVLSYLNSRSLARKMRELESNKENIFTGAPIANASTGVREFDSLGNALTRASELLSLPSN